MSSPSIKKNFIYKSILTLSTYLINLMIFPYVSRVLGVEYVGLVNFVDNTVNYFLLFATMGMSILGIREIAAVKNDYQRKSRIFQFDGYEHRVYIIYINRLSNLHSCCT